MKIELTFDEEKIVLDDEGLDNDNYVNVTLRITNDIGVIESHTKITVELDGLRFALRAFEERRRLKNERYKVTE